MHTSDAISRALGVCAACSLLLAGAQAGDVTVAYTYDADGRLARAQYSAGGATSDVRYLHVPMGDLTVRASYAPGDYNADFDGDGLVDRMEWDAFGDLQETAAGDPDADGLANSNEFAIGGNPTLPDTDFDSQDDREEYIAGTALNDGNVYFMVGDLDRAVGGMARVTILTKPGRTYQIQSSPKAGGVYTNSGVPYVSSGNSTLDLDFVASTSCFYRVWVWLTP